MTMTLHDIVAALGLTVHSAPDLLDRTVAGGYAGDLLSDVLANARKGDVWITLHTHPNIVAVASARELAGILIVHGRTPEEATLAKAREEKIPILISTSSTYAVISRLCQLGVQ